MHKGTYPSYVYSNGVLCADPVYLCSRAKIIWYCSEWRTGLTLIYEMSGKGVSAVVYKVSGKRVNSVVYVKGEWGRG